MTLPSEQNKRSFQHGDEPRRDDRNAEEVAEPRRDQGAEGAASEGAQHLDNILKRINALLAEPQPAQALRRELRAETGFKAAGQPANVSPDALYEDNPRRQTTEFAPEPAARQGARHEWSPDYEIYVAGEEFDEAAEQASRAFIEGARDHAARSSQAVVEPVEEPGATDGENLPGGDAFQPSPPEDMLAPYSEVLNEVRDYFEDRHSLDPDDRLSDRLGTSVSEPAMLRREAVPGDLTGDRAERSGDGSEIFSPLTFENPLVTQPEEPASPSETAEDYSSEDTVHAPVLSDTDSAASGEVGDQIALRAGDLNRFRRELMDRIGQLETVMGNHFVDRTDIARDAARMAVEMTLQSLEETPVGQRVAALEGAFEKFRQIQLDREQQTGEMLEKLGAALLKSRETAPSNQQQEGASDRERQLMAAASAVTSDGDDKGKDGAADGEENRVEADDVERLAESLESDGIHDERRDEANGGGKPAAGLPGDREGAGEDHPEGSAESEYAPAPLGGVDEAYPVRDVEATPVPAAPVVSTAGLDYSGDPDVSAVHGSAVDETAVYGPVADGGDWDGGTISELQEVHELGEADDDAGDGAGNRASDNEPVAMVRQQDRGGEGQTLEPAKPGLSREGETDMFDKQAVNMQAIDQNYSAKSARLREQFKNSTIVSNDDDLIAMQRRGARPAVIIVVVALLLAAAGIALRNNDGSMKGIFGGIFDGLIGGQSGESTVPPAKQPAAVSPDGSQKRSGDDVNITGNISRRDENAIGGKISPRLSDPVEATSPEALLPADSGSLSLPPALIGPYSLRHKAANGEAEAQYEVARRFGLGHGIEQNYEEAVRWYQYAAAQGFAPAQYRLATYYERGRGVKRDLGRAGAWYKRAAELGNVKAMHNLAVLGTTMDPEKPDYDLALRWFREAAKRNLADSQFNLAILYQGGVGVQKNNVEAFKWFSLAARQGDKDAAARRDGLEKKLSQKELLLASNLLQGWEPVPVKFEANQIGKLGRHMTSTMSHAEETVSRSRVLTAQILLRKIGYPLAQADGALNEETVEAIKTFEKDKGLPVTGKVSAALLQALNLAAL